MGESIFAEIWQAEQDAMQKMTNKPGWRYHDLPRLSYEAFNKFIELAGEGNLHWITFALYPAKGEMPATKRGQVMISPDGLERLADHLKETQ